MTNEEIILKAKEEIRLRGLSPDTEVEYLTGIRVLARYYDNRPLEELHEPELRAFLLHLIESGRKAGTVNRYNSLFRQNEYRLIYPAFCVYYSRGNRNDDN